MEGLELILCPEKNWKKANVSVSWKPLGCPGVWLPFPPPWGWSLQPRRPQDTAQRCTPAFWWSGQLCEACAFPQAFEAVTGNYTGSSLPREFFVSECFKQPQNKKWSGLWWCTIYRLRFRWHWEEKEEMKKKTCSAGTFHSITRFFIRTALVG